MNVLWVVRDQRYNDNEPVKRTQDCMYMLFTSRPRLSNYGWASKGTHISNVQARHWHSCTGKELHLKPGEGPIAINVQLDI